MARPFLLITASKLREHRTSQPRQAHDEPIPPAEFEQHFGSVIGWVIIELGVPSGTIVGFDINTTLFSGNEATACSVYGLDRLSPAPDSPDDAQVCPPRINKYGDEPPQAELLALLEREAALSL
ncbi:hypothetical protein PtB15_7B620 [Puccinia triticina]|nr:hypothetical protein PtB15_2B18 [Puccinia triticina]WAR56770.1 hypothetical protein PtB15_7B620 [Puccinia triticina]